MNTLTQLLSQPITETIGLVLLHSLWQGALVAIAFAICLRVVRRPNARYALGLVALAAIVAAPIVTGWQMRSAAPPVVAAVPVATPATVTTDVIAPPAELPVVSGSPAPLAIETAAVQPVLSVAAIAKWFTVGWMVGIPLLALRLLLNWLALQRVRFAGRIAIAPAVADQFEQLRDRAKVSRRIGLFESARVNAPLALGWLRPVVLFPVGLAAQLTPTQVEAILAHELAHIRRHDYIVNLVQCVIETLLFYHPAVWWVNRVIRQEREACCDASASAVCGDEADYAEALLQLAQTLWRSPRFASGAADGNLHARIRRLLGDDRADRPHSLRPRVAGWTLVAVVALTTIGFSGYYNRTAALAEEPVAAGTLADLRTALANHKTKQELLQEALAKITLPANPTPTQINEFVDGVLEVAHEESKIYFENYEPWSFHGQSVERPTYPAILNKIAEVPPASVDVLVRLMKAKQSRVVKLLDSGEGPPFQEADRVDFEYFLLREVVFSAELPRYRDRLLELMRDDVWVIEQISWQLELDKPWMKEAGPLVIRAINNDPNGVSYYLLQSAVEIAPERVFDPLIKRLITQRSVEKSDHGPRDTLGLLVRTYPDRIDAIDKAADTAWKKILADSRDNETLMSYEKGLRDDVIRHGSRSALDMQVNRLKTIHAGGKDPYLDYGNIVPDPKRQRELSLEYLRTGVLPTFEYSGDPAEFFEWYDTHRDAIRFDAKTRKWTKE